METILSHWFWKAGGWLLPVYERLHWVVNLPFWKVVAAVFLCFQLLVITLGRGILYLKVEAK